MEFDLSELDNKQLELLARIHAHLCGDGNVCIYKTSEKDRINRISISYFNSNIDLINSFRKDMNEFFGIKMAYSQKAIRLTVKSIRIGKFLGQLGEYGTRKWRIPSIIKNASKKVKLEWIKAFCHDEGYTPIGKTVIKIKSMNLEGLKDVKELVDSLEIECWITGINCDGSWYLTIRKMNELKDFYKKPSRKKVIAGARLP